MSLVSERVYPTRGQDQTVEFGDLLVNYLEQLHTDYVFGIPGGAIVPLFDALARSERRGGPRAIVSRHETGAAFMADGYTRETGRLGVCCSTTGPGATNLVTGVASAYANAIPMLVITGQTALPSFGRGAFQDSSCSGIDTVALFKCCTRYSTLVSHIDQLEQKLIAAIMTAMGSKPGPVHLSIPLDVLGRPASTLANFDLQFLLSNHSKPYNPKDVDKLVDMLAASSHTLFVIGGGAADAAERILGVAERIGAGIVATPHGKGLIPPAHPAFYGLLGYGGHGSAEAALESSRYSTILCVGTLVSERAGRNWLERISAEQQLIHVDSHEDYLAHTPMSNLQIRGCIGSIFEQVSDRLNTSALTPQKSIQESSEPALRVNDEDNYDNHNNECPIKPQRLMCELPRLFPADTCYVVDSGAGLAWALHYLNPGLHTNPLSGNAGIGNNWFRASVEFTSMGWAIGAAIGTALGGKGPVVCITGDGSLLMSGQEITLAVQEQLPIVFIVLNDAAMGLVKHGLRMIGAEPVGYAMPTVNYAHFAETLGARGYRIETPEDLVTLNSKRFFADSGPTLLDICIDPEAVPPFAHRINTLKATKS